ncbi:hypothetical protein [Nocardia arizonensis]|uniref:hypothetical protein n=1 Tax=Nocardia arizonensis TaxID=1141647 RepID=UPI001951DA08|nr:hypothetical protein [Nocardia arizonensis]
MPLNLQEQRISIHEREGNGMRAPREKPDDAALRAGFERELTSALAGEGVSIHSYLDFRTFEALAAVSGRHPNPPSELIEAAHAAFAAQLDGSTAKAEQEKLPWFAREGDDTTPR